jgi:hypothetical protein
VYLNYLNKGKWGVSLVPRRPVGAVRVTIRQPNTSPRNAAAITCLQALGPQRLALRGSPCRNRILRTPIEADPASP